MFTREDMIEQMPKGIVCAEIGVFEGEFSEKIINTIRPSKMYMVDPFDGPMMSADKNGQNFKTINLEDAYANLKIKYQNQENVCLFRGLSRAFFETIPNDHLDFVYIDGDHGYAGVKFDLEQSFFKVKTGGYICGHDYFDGFPGVVAAVDEFCALHNLKKTVTTEDGCPSYRILLEK